MDFTKNIILQKYVDSATRQFNESENRLSQIEGNLEIRMNGKTNTSIIGSVFGSICWLVIFVIFFWCIKGYINSILYLICSGLSIALSISLLIDEIISFFYYRKIFAYKDDITQLKNHLIIGENSIKANLDTFIESRASGWNYVLNPPKSSILKQSTYIESIINSMESLKCEFINSLKNFLFYTFTFTITAVGSWGLFGIANQIINKIGGKSITGNTVTTLCIICMIIAIPIEILLAKLVWSKTDCAVTNNTLFIVPNGPILFLVLVAIATILIRIVIWAVGVFVNIVLPILIVLMIGATLFESSSGD